MQPARAERRVVSVGAVESLAGIFRASFVLPVSVIPLIALYYVIRWAVSGSIRDAAKSEGGDLAHPTARQILDERYARGEIGRDEHGRMRRDIEG